MTNFISLYKTFFYIWFLTLSLAVGLEIKWNGRGGMFKCNKREVDVGDLEEIISPKAFLKIAVIFEIG